MVKRKKMSSFLINISLLFSCLILASGGNLGDDDDDHDFGKLSSSDDDPAASAAKGRRSLGDEPCPHLGSMVDCSGLQLGSVPMYIPHWVEILDLSNNQIRHLEPGSLDAFRNLRELDLSKNNLTRLPNNLFMANSSILKLKLDNNQLESFPLLDNLLNLTTFALHHNHIRDLSDATASVYKKLTSLDLSSNRISTIPAKFLFVASISHDSSTLMPTTSSPAPRKNSSLLHISFANNRIEVIEKDAFANLSALETLKLSKNKIENLPMKLFEPLQSLKELDMSKNKLQNITGLLFSGMSSLQTLKLRRNELNVLEDGAFWTLERLQSLYLERNNLPNVTKGWLFGMKSLRELHLSFNAIKLIEGDGWDFCQQLWDLRLDNNQLYKINSTTFSKLGSLNTLALDQNNISFIEDGSFKSMSLLESLSLTENDVAYVIEDANAPFTGLDRLQKLGLARNNIKSVPVRAFAGLGKSLKSLDLTGNPIMTTEEMAFVNLKGITELKIDSAVFLCDCKLRWLVMWLRVMTVTHPEVVNAVCSYPEEKKGSRLLELKADALKCDGYPFPFIIEAPHTQFALKKSNLTMMCKAASSSSSKMVFIWRKDHEILKFDNSRSSVITYAQTTNETSIDVIEYANLLHLVNISDSDEGNYQCIATNSFGSVYAHKSKITVHVRPTFSRTPQNVTIKAGQAATLICAAQGQPHPEVSWMRHGGDDFPAARERRMHFMPQDDKYFIVESKVEDNGIYTCVAKNEAGIAMANATLTVLEPPNFIKPMQDKIVNAGETAVLDCMASGSPKPTSNWTKDNGTLIATERHFFTADNQLLIMVQTIESDSGLYACNMSNSQGSVSQSMRLTIMPENDALFEFNWFPDQWTSTLIIVTIVIAVIVLTSVIWVCIIYKTRRVDNYYMTETGETVIPDDYIDKEFTKISTEYR